MHLSFTSQEVWRIRDLGDRFLWIGLRQIFDWPPRLHLSSLVDQEHLRGVKSRHFWKTGLRLHHVTVESPSRHSLHLSHLKSVHDVQKFRHHLTGVSSSSLTSPPFAKFASRWLWGFCTDTCLPGKQIENSRYVRVAFCYSWIVS